MRRSKIALPHRTPLSFALAVSLLGASGAAAAQSTANEKLAYVESVAPDRVFYCEATPQSNSTNKTLMVIEFELNGEGPVDAKMTVTGSVQGRFYTARIGWRGSVHLGAHLGAHLDKDGAHILLNEATSFDADILPGKARWSDPSGDVVRLRIDDYKGLGSQAYILRGTQVTELGTNDLSCLDGPRR